MFLSLLEIIQRRRQASALTSLLNLCKVGLNHLLICTGSPHCFPSGFDREKKKNTEGSTVLVSESFAVINDQSYGCDEKWLVNRDSCKETEYQ